jgi:cell division protein FtsL
MRKARADLILEWMLMYVARRITRKSSRRRLNRSREVVLILLICAALCVVFLLVFGNSGYLELQKKEREIRTLEAQRDLRLEENRRLAQDVEDLKNDMKRVEKPAREELKLSKKDEIVIFLQDPPKKAAPRK